MIPSWSLSCCSREIMSFQVDYLFSVAVQYILSMILTGGRYGTC